MRVKIKYLWNIFCVGLFILISYHVVSVYFKASVKGNDIELLADHLKVHYEHGQNPSDSHSIGPHTGSITLTNLGPQDVTANNWEIYFCAICLMFPRQLRNKTDAGHLIIGTNIRIFHLNGCMYKLKPTKWFGGFKKDVDIEIPFEAARRSISRTDQMPRWFITDASGKTARTIESTSNELLNFVADFKTAAKWNGEMDKYQYGPFSPEKRFSRNAAASDLGEPTKRVIPTPVSENYDDSVRVDVGSGDWVVVYGSEQVKSEAKYLAAKWNTEAVDQSKKPEKRFVMISLGNIAGQQIKNEEAYSLSVVPATSVISITGSNSSGVFYGIQTLLSLSSLSSEIPKTEIVDYPRFPYRGMHVDVGRNFFGKDDILKLLEVMAMYKLNNFHFHLTDDEGWRLEIDGLPELTEIGAHRCFDLDENKCIMSQLGSGPTTRNSGSGFYSQEDYKEILQFADERHIQVIPEFDMPGHMHAGIKAMEARYHKNEDTEYLLSDFHDDSDYLSVQLYRDNAVNPCLTSTYKFVRKIIQEITTLHKDIQPLKVFNFGGDEVSEKAWVKSKACQLLIDTEPELKSDYNKPEHTVLHRYFVKNVAAIAKEYGLDIAGWEDGLKYKGAAMKRSDVPNNNAYVFAWNNIWENGNGERAYKYANEGYKVIIAHATHFYFDHPQEPDPEERGLYWAAHFTDTAKTFGYYADNVYENIQETRLGQPLDRKRFCQENSCEALHEGRREHIIGLQGNLWTETVRTSEQFDGMVYPRILAVAERGWHKASWEDVSACGKICDSLKRKDWTEFANTLGYKELKRLSKLNVKYYIPPPGARLHKEDGNFKLEVNVNLPGQPIVYSIDNGTTWTDITPARPVAIDSNLQVKVKIRSVDLMRSGRSITLPTESVVSGQSRECITVSLVILNIVFLYCFMMYT